MYNEWYKLSKDDFSGIDVEKLKLSISEDKEFLNKIIAYNDSWYKRSSVTYRLEKEAGVMGVTFVSLMTALLMVLVGSTISVAAKSTNVPEDQIQKALQDDRLVDMAQEWGKKKGYDATDAQDYDKDWRKHVKQPWMNTPEPKEVKPATGKAAVEEIVKKDASGNTTVDMGAVKDQIKRHEGVKYKVYNDSRGIPTIGIGFNLRDADANYVKSLGLDLRKLRSGQQTLNDAQINTWFDREFERAVEIAKSFAPNLEQLPAEVQMVLINMSYNLGERKIFGFEKMRAAIMQGNYLEAAKEMKDSKWFDQVGNRSEELAQIMSDVAV